MSRRAELLPEIQHLRDVEGLMWREIGDRLGIALQTAQDYYADPDGLRVRTRKAKTNGTCIDCGGPTISDGSGAADRCGECHKAYRHAERYWTPQRCIAAIQRWAVEHDGVAPSACDWNNGQRPGWAPAASIVQEQCGTWNAAVEAAGLNPRGLGQHQSDRTLDDYVEAIQRWAREHGAPPTEAQWKPARNGYPGASSVIYRFGSWNAAIAAAGFRPRPALHPRAAALLSAGPASRTRETPASVAASAPEETGS